MKKILELVQAVMLQGGCDPYICHTLGNLRLAGVIPAEQMYTVTADINRQLNGCYSLESYTGLIKPVSSPWVHANGPTRRQARLIWIAEMLQDNPDAINVAAKFLKDAYEKSSETAA